VALGQTTSFNVLTPFGTAFVVHIGFPAAPAVEMPSDATSNKIKHATATSIDSNRECTT
jgi:hypothetical protein